MNKADLRIVFMGTPEFAVPSLAILLENNFNVVAVVTVPDKPAGRGLQLHESAVKKFAIAHQLPLLQPVKLKDEQFISALASYKANLQIVVAFRMLPQIVWQMPELGTFNLHGSLLPQYRGAAPINWAIMNGEKETGVTTFFLKHEIDTGNILHSAKCPINPEDNAGSIHDKLMLLGADLVLKTVVDIMNQNVHPLPQEQLMATATNLAIAPKILKQDCKIDWNLTCQSIFNKVRGLSPFPTAFADFTDGTTIISMKIFETTVEVCAHQEQVGKLISDNKNFLKIAVSDGYVHLTNLQLAGKRRMNTMDFLRGFQFSGSWKSHSTSV